MLVLTVGILFVHVGVSAANNPQFVPEHLIFVSEHHVFSLQTLAPRVQRLDNMLMFQLNIRVIQIMRVHRSHIRVPSSLLDQLLQIMINDLILIILVSKLENLLFQLLNPLKKAQKSAQRQKNQKVKFLHWRGSARPQRPHDSPADHKHPQAA